MVPTPSPLPPVWLTAQSVVWRIEYSSALQSAMDLLTTPEIWVAFLALFVLELILGVDNVVFISILTNRLPKSQQAKARIIGLSLAMLLRIVLLFFATWIVGLTDTLIGIGSIEALQFSGRDLILLAGGLFLIYKATMEIHHKLEGKDGATKAGKGSATFGAVIVQILLIDLVFSLDSVITAVGMTREIVVMVAAVVLSMGLMMVVAGTIAEFVNRHPTVKMLALSFLILIGATLAAEGLGVHVSKGLIYGPIAFAIAVEVLNLIYRRRQERRSGDARQPVRLHAGKRIGVTAGELPEGLPGRGRVGARSSASQLPSTEESAPGPPGPDDAEKDARH